MVTARQLRNSTEEDGHGPWVFAQLNMAEVP
jgi:hypothetical protein